MFGLSPKRIAQRVMINALLGLSLLLGESARVAAQEVTKPRDWSGREVTEGCHAHPQDITGLETSLYRHISYRVKALYKLQWSWFPSTSPTDAQDERLKHPRGPYQETVANLRRQTNIALLPYDPRRHWVENELKDRLKDLRVRRELAENEIKRRREYLEQSAEKMENQARSPGFNGIENHLRERYRKYLQPIRDGLKRLETDALSLRNEEQQVEDDLLAYEQAQKEGRPFKLSGYGPGTSVLIYDVGVVDGKYAVCVWLLSVNGIEAAASRPLPNMPISTLLQRQLRVDTRAAARAHAPRRGGLAQGRTGPHSSEKSPQSGSDPRDAMGALNAASDILLPPVIAEKLRIVRPDRILILPAADISTIPFAALPLNPDLLLVDLADLVVLTDTDPLFVPQSSARFSGGSQLLVIGDPDLANDKKWSFTPLPQARAEAVSAAQMLGGQAIVGKEATRAKVLRYFEQHQRALGVVYFATHGLADPVNPMDASFLALSGEHLYARDIKRLRLKQSPLVVMSACQTGLGKVFEGGVFGLTRAWHFAGASEVVMSLWNIDDAATHQLMVDFVSRYQRGERPESALRRAMIAARARDADPALWAGFAVSMGSRAPDH
jgi:hypothetical protein